MPCIERIQKIYSDGRHNVFTDMERWKGAYYVAFRNGNGHARPGPAEVQGKVFVIRSTDLREWEVCARISTPGDDRDPALLHLGDELGVYFCTVVPQDPDQSGNYEGGLGVRPDSVQSHMAFTSDGTTWSAPEPVHERDYVFWQVERFGDVCYATSWGHGSQQGTVKLVRSPDGHGWENAAAIQPGSFPNETGLWMTEDGALQLVSRALTREMSHLSQSAPPYADWETSQLNYTVHCPVMRPVGDELWVAGKTITAQLPSSVEVPPEPSPEKIASLARQDERLAKTPQDWHTVIWRLRGGYLDPLLVLPSRGDCGYPGLVVEEDRVLMSFYSQHDIDAGPTPVDGENANEIYLAEIAL